MKRRIRKYIDIGRIPFSAALLLIALFVPMAEGAALGLYIAAFVVIGYKTAVRSARNIARGKVFDENLLMLIAAVGAFLLKEYGEGVAVLLLSQIGEMFEDYAVNKSRGSVEALIGLMPESVRLLHDGEVREVAPEDVHPGDTVQVRVGERIPLDGILLSAYTALDTSALTGESLPIDIREGGAVAAGCVNLSDVVEIVVTKEYEDSTVSRILDLVENSAAKKAASERFITRFARYYTPIVVVLALLVAVIPPLFNGQWEQWIYRALSFLVISCPCALVISVPLSFFRGIGLAAKDGILIKGSNYIELLSKTGSVAFDKTGTLTKGCFSVAEVVPITVTEEELISVVKGLEKNSNHPIARSIRSCRPEIAEKEGFEEYRETAGSGISARLGTVLYRVGSLNMMILENIEAPKAVGSGTAIYLAADGICLGYLLVRDTIKEESYGVADALRQLGVRRVAMLSGDRSEICGEVAEALSLDEYHAGMRPEEKLTQVLDWKTDGVVVFAGDGINDAPALTGADIGIAMGGMGSDIAVETADVVILNDSPQAVVRAVKLSKKTVRRATENIVFALGIKFSFLVLATLGITNMWMAIFADVGVSVLAILNALRK